jgi:hypothetical protein
VLWTIDVQDAWPLVFDNATLWDLLVIVSPSGEPGGRPLLLEIEPAVAQTQESTERVVNALSTALNKTPMRTLIHVSAVSA